MQLFRFNGSDRRAPRYAAVFATKDSTGSRLSVLSMPQIKETRIPHSPASDPIIGAMSRIIGRARHKVPAESWIGRILERKPKMLVGIALANKMARQIWAMLA